MAGDTRERMIAAATELFRERGYDGSGFRDVVERAGAPRGSSPRRKRTRAFNRPPQPTECRMVPQVATASG